MRSDSSVETDARSDDHWDLNGRGGEESQPFSGSERNKWFYNIADQKGRNFTDLSSLSGMDSIADGRVFSICDFNRDGRSDILLTSANAPLLKVFENQIQTDNQVIAFRFVGGMTKSHTGKRLSSRDGYGAVVTLELSDDLKIKREFRCGEGFAGQNSDTLLIGIGEFDSVKQIRVAWPSGVKSELENVKANSLVTLFESPSDGESQEQIEDYLVKNPQ